MSGASSAASSIAPQDNNTQAESELADFLLVRQQRRSLFPRAALIGVLVGLSAVAFRFVLAEGDLVRNGLIQWAGAYPLIGWIFPVLFSAAGAAIAVFLVKRFSPEASGSGIPHLESVLHRYRDMDWRSILPVKFIGGMFALGSGMVMGREGPSIQIAGAVADAASRVMKVSTRDRLTLIAAGAGAGLAAAFNAPLAGVMFVLEEIQRDFRPIVLGAVFVAAAMANIVSRLLYGQQAVFEVPFLEAPPLTALPGFVVLGVLAGVLGVVFNRGLIGVQTWLAKWIARSAVGTAAAVGALVGLVAWFSPIAVGGGHNLAEAALLGQISLAAIPLWFVLRLGLTLLCYATGAPGGIFLPLLVLGALIGLAVGEGMHAVAPSVVPHPEAFAIVGMAAYFVAIVRAPLTGIVLILEMTANFEQLLPLIVACFTAYAVAELMGDLPIYEMLLQRDLRRSGVQPHTAGPVVIELEVEPHAPFAGKKVRELALPSGCLLVRCLYEGREWVPTAETMLLPHMQLIATVAPDVPNGLLSLRHGCAAAE